MTASDPPGTNSLNEIPRLRANRACIEATIAPQPVTGIPPEPSRIFDSKEIRLRPGLGLIGQKRPLTHPDLQFNRMIIAKQIAPDDGPGERFHFQADRFDDQVFG